MDSHFIRYLKLQMLADKEKELALKEIYEETNKKLEEYKEKAEDNKRYFEHKYHTKID